MRMSSPQKWGSAASTASHSPSPSSYTEAFNSPLSKEADVFKKTKGEKAFLLLIALSAHILPFFLINRDFTKRLTELTDPLFTSLINPTLGRYWDKMMNSYSPFTVSFIVSVAVHQAVYFLWCLPGFLFQFIPSMNKLKYQPNRAWPWRVQINCLWFVLKSHIGYQIPFSCLIYFFCEQMGFNYSFDKIPSWPNLAIAMFGCSVLEDTWHYALHRLMHNPTLYKNIHKVHHEHQNPFALTAEYAHPIEQMVLGIGFIAGVVLYGTHIIHIWLWMACRTLQACESHMGYDTMLFVNPWRLLPWYSARGHHDYHHEFFVGNYASFFTWWDDILDTSSEYHLVMHQRNTSASSGNEVSLGTGTKGMTVEKTGFCTPSTTTSQVSKGKVE
eukprot:GHVN01003276.1.p1 GENE.GHVN01003276.1~~GHVN01003276.1.p1  ORF type:complete len:386 (+),score=44.34 GHVN01003276.1:97-1254(+)